MIDPIASASTALAAPATTFADSGKDDFNAALKAAQKAAARDAEHQREVAEIKDKGFTDWARDTQIEKLKEELRKKVMAEMGLEEDQLGRMAPAIQQVLEQKIQDEVEQRLEKELAKQSGQTDQTAAAQPMAPGKTDRLGNNFPVIPGLAWPGGGSAV